MSSTKRNRNDDSGNYSTARKRAMAISAKINGKFPYTDYGIAHIKRGSDYSLRDFGATYKDASDQQKQMRRELGYYGRGKYNLLSAGGRRAAARNMFGKTLTSAVESRATNAALGFIGRGLYMGRGAYNNLVTGGAADMSTGTVPMMNSRNDETGAVTVSHREYVSDIFGPGIRDGDPVPFDNISYPLNPGIQNTFLWLSQIAQNFEEYEFKQLLFHYRSTTSEATNNTSGQVGTLIMATNYNSSNNKFYDKQSMIEYAHAHSCRITEHMTHGVECDPKKNALSGLLYVRSSPVVTGQDLKTYDLGLFQVAIANCPSQYNGYPIGELWVEYVVELRKPRLFVSRGLEIDNDQWVGKIEAEANTGQIFGILNGESQILTGQQNNIGCKLKYTTDDTAHSSILEIVFPASYVGPLEIKIEISSETGSNYLTKSPDGFSLFGNVKELRDMLHYSGYNWIFLSPYDLTTRTIAGGGQRNPNLIVLLHVYTTTATYGIDNKIVISFPSADNYGSLARTYLSVSQYNSNGVNPNTEPTKWLDYGNNVYPV
jgi:hypothetical protein